jgi:hypothetical protein
MYQSTKPYKSSEISSITVTHWQNCLFLQVEAVVELLEFCLRTTYFHVDHNFFQQKYGMAMGNSLLPIVGNIFMEHSEKLSLGLAQDKPSLWLRCADDTSVVWPHGLERLQNFPSHFSSLRPSIHFTIETKLDSGIPFLNVLVVRKGPTLATKL